MAMGIQHLSMWHGSSSGWKVSNISKAQHLSFYSVSSLVVETTHIPKHLGNSREVNGALVFLFHGQSRALIIVCGPLEELLWTISILNIPRWLWVLLKTWFWEFPFLKFTDVFCCLASRHLNPRNTTEAHGPPKRLLLLLLSCFSRLRLCATP